MKLLQFFVKWCGFSAAANVHTHDGGEKLLELGPASDDVAKCLNGAPTANFNKLAVVKRFTKIYDILGADINQDKT